MKHLHKCTMKKMNLCLRQEVLTPAVRSEDTVGFRLQLSIHLACTASGRNIPSLMNDHPSLHCLFPPLSLSRWQWICWSPSQLPTDKGRVGYSQPVTLAHPVRLPNTPTSCEWFPFLQRTHASTGRTCRLLAGRLQAWGWNPQPSRWEVTLLTVAIITISL